MGKAQTLIIDASALLAVSKREPGYERIVDAMADAGRLVMSTMTVTEIMIQLLDHLPEEAAQFELDMVRQRVEFIPIELRHALIAAEARLKFPINIGDCFVYALAKLENGTILTLDRDFRSCDVPVLLFV